MTEDEVRSIFPSGALVKRPFENEEYVLTLSNDLFDKILKPNYPGALFGIEFNRKGKAIRHWLALFPEM